MRVNLLTAHAPPHSAFIIDYGRFAIIQQSPGNTVYYVVALRASFMGARRTAVETNTVKPYRTPRLRSASRRHGASRGSCFVAYRSHRLLCACGGCGAHAPLRKLRPLSLSLRRPVLPASAQAVARRCVGTIRGTVVVLAGVDRSSVHTREGSPRRWEPAE